MSEVRIAVGQERNAAAVPVIPARVARLVEKLAARESIPLVLAAKPNTTDEGEKLPADVYVAGPG